MEVDQIKAVNRLYEKTKSKLAMQITAFGTDEYDRGIMNYLNCRLRALTVVCDILGIELKD